MEDKIKEVLAAVFELTPAQIDSNSSQDSIESWDSIRHMNLIVALEEEFGVQFTDDEIVEMVNFQIIVLTLQEKGK